MGRFEKQSKKEAVLFVGQIPPPWTGQGVIHQMLLDNDYPSVKLVPLVMRFSKNSSDQGNISLAKMWSLLRLISKSYHARMIGGVSFLYFSPGGPGLAAVVRDAIYLCCVRPIMSGTMLVYHSSGVAQYIEGLHPLLRFFLFKAFSNVEIAVQLSESAPPDGSVLQAQEVIIIPNAVHDQARGRCPSKNDGVLRILFVGIVTREKGVTDLLKACLDLVRQQVSFQLTIAGSFASASEENELRDQAKELPAGSVIFAGALAGDSKLATFRSADVFCFPSFWPKETFPLVLLEALSFGIPIVASRWRGIPDLIGEEQECGVLVDCHAIGQIAEALATLAHDSKLWRRQSEHARLRYERFFTLEPFLEAYNQAFLKLVQNRNPQSRSMAGVTSIAGEASPYPSRSKQ